MNELLVEGLRSALQAHCSAERVRALEAGAPLPLWQQLAPLGYADAFMDEAQGGSGLDLAAGFEPTEHQFLLAHWHKPLHEVLNTTSQPLNTLTEKELCPGKEKLAVLNDEWR